MTTLTTTIAKIRELMEKANEPDPMLGAKGRLVVALLNAAPALLDAAEKIDKAVTDLNELLTEMCAAGGKNAREWERRLRGILAEMLAEAAHAGGGWGMSCHQCGQPGVFLRWWHSWPSGFPWATLKCLNPACAFEYRSMDPDHRGKRLRGLPTWMIPKREYIPTPNGAQR